MTRTQVQIEFTYSGEGPLVFDLEEYLCDYLDDAGAVDVIFEVTDNEQV